MKQLNMANNIKSTLIIWAFLLALFFEIINQHKMEIEGIIITFRFFNVCVSFFFLLRCGVCQLMNVLIKFDRNRFQLFPLKNLWFDFIFVLYSF